MRYTILASLAICLGVAVRVDGNVITDDACSVCTDLLRLDGGGEIEQHRLKSASCRVLRHTEASGVTDREWKVHSARIFATRASADLLQAIKALQEADTTPFSSNTLSIVCGLMGASSSPCMCPADPDDEKYSALMSALSAAVDEAKRDDPSGSFNMGDLASTLGCGEGSSSEDKLTPQLGLIEMGRNLRTLKAKHRARTGSLLSVRDFESCGGVRKKDDYDLVKAIAQDVDRSEGRKRKVGDLVAGLTVGGAGAILASTTGAPLAAPIAAIWHAFAYIGGEHREDRERILCKEIVEETYRMIMANLATLKGDRELWEAEQKIAKLTMDAEEVDLVHAVPVRSEVKRALSFLLSMAPFDSGLEGLAKTGADGLEMIVREYLSSLLTDIPRFREVAVRYLLHAFFVDELLWEGKRCEDAPNRRIKDHSFDKDYTDCETYRERLEVLVLRKLNSYRGLPALMGLELTCGLGGRPGKIPGDKTEGKKLWCMFLGAAKDKPWEKVELYVNIGNRRIGSPAVTRTL